MCVLVETTFRERDNQVYGSVRLYVTQFFDRSRSASRHTLQFIRFDFKHFPRKKSSSRERVRNSSRSVEKFDYPRGKKSRSVRQLNLSHYDEATSSQRFNTITSLICQCIAPLLFSKRPNWKLRTKLAVGTAARGRQVISVSAAAFSRDASRRDALLSSSASEFFSWHSIKSDFREARDPSNSSARQYPGYSRFALK